MISPQQIAYILAVADLGSVSKAAAHCFVTQPTLSMQLKKAEDLLGYQIFFRNGAKFELTDFGANLVPVLRQIQGDFGAIQRIQEMFSGSYTERLRIGIIPTVSAYLLLDNFSNWKKLLPNTLVYIEELKTEDLLVAIDQRKIDLGILAGPVENPNLRVTPLFAEEILAYAPGIEGDPLLVDTLQHLQPWLLSKGNCLRTQMMQFCEINEDQTTRWNYQGGNMDLLMRMVDQEGGYTLIPELYLPFVAQQTGFKTIRDDEGNFPGRSIVAVNPQRHSNWDSMEKIIRGMQHKYNKKPNRQMEILSWK